MSFWLTLRVALRALGKNKMRAGLTVLGVVIGIAAVTAMVSLGQSASGLVKGQFDSLGPNVIVIFPGRARRGPIDQPIITLTAKDSDAIAAECPAVLASSPLVGTGGQVVYGHTNYAPNEMIGVGTGFQIVRNWEVQRGGFFTEREVISASKVCVLGQTVSAKLFQTADPVGQTVRIKNIPFRVIGVLEKKGANMLGDDQDNIVLMPYTTVRKRLQGSEFDNVSAIMASGRTTPVPGEAENEIKQLLAERHHIHPGERPDFAVTNMTEIAAIFTMITGTLTLMLTLIAAISLFVGGVGIMNIMLVSVTERTREIGIRLAVGARGRDILRQFLVEAVLLSCIGGILGFGLGVFASTSLVMIINAVTTGTKWPVVVSLEAGAVAFLVAAGVGVFFGFYPALRASRLDPIEALRYE